MTDLAQHFDEHVRKARFYPALLTLLPLTIMFALIWPGFSVEALLPVAATAGLPFFLCNVVRDRGQRLEKRLIKKWGGLPSTRMLRLTNTENNPDQLRQRRHRLEELTHNTLPTAEEEQRHPGRSDERYVCATRELIVHARRHEDRHPLVKAELINYGFGRNMLALKPVAVILLLALLAVDGCVLILGEKPAPAATTMAIHVVLLLGWVTIVRSSWILRQGNTYAERLFETLLDPHLDAAAS